MMKNYKFIPTAILLLFIGSLKTAIAQESANKVIRKVTIVNNEGKPQPDIYAYLKGGDKRKFFKSDANGVLTYIVDTTNVDKWDTVLIIDHERSGGYRDGYVSLEDEAETYDTKEDVQKLLQAGKPLQVNHCEEMPEYPGGTGECVRYMMNEAVRIMKERNIPVCHGCCGIPGRTIIRFVIDKEGNVTSPEVLRGVDPVLDKIGLEVIKSMPKWKPGKVEGKPVPCIYVLPMMYELR